MESSERDHRRTTIEPVITSILIIHTLSVLNSREARHLQVKLTGSMWVPKNKHNPDRSKWHRAQLHQQQTWFPSGTQGYS
jgi:hypothetical protein